MPSKYRRHVSIGTEERSEALDRKMVARGYSSEAKFFQKIIDSIPEVAEKDPEIILIPWHD